MIKIKKTRLVSSLMATASIALILILFSTSVSATAITRPISDFTDTNNNIAAWADPDSGLTILPHGFYIDQSVLPDAPQSIADCIHSGSVVEQQLKDGSIMYKVNLHVKGALMYIANSATVLMAGEIDYHFQATVIVYNGELGDPIPNLLQIWFPFPPFLPEGSEPIGISISSHLTGKGIGTFLSDAAAHYYGFAPGDIVNVKVSQVGTFDKDFEAGHPNYYVDDGSFWPVEIVFFH